MDGTINCNDRVSTAIKCLLYHGAKQENITIVSLLAAEKTIGKVLG